MLRKLTIIGPGLLGGSLGLAARARKAAAQVVIWARRHEAADDAWKIGAADQATTNLAQAVADAELVVLATPIGVMEPLVRQFLPHLPAGCVVTDVGSVKYPVVSALTQALGRAGQFVGSHPMAGSEQAGIEASRRDLFEKAVCIVTPTEQTDPHALEVVVTFWKQIGCSLRTLSPAAHDEIVARVSHLPHMIAAAVVNVVCRDGAQPLDFSGPGFRDFSRIASGPPEMWTEICQQNRQEIGRALDATIQELTKLRTALANNDPIELQAMLKRAKHYRDELRFRV